MNLPRENFAERRGLLAAQIARQRGELVEAYHNLEKPIHYAEYGMRGFGFLRKNPWVIAAVPAVLSIASTLLGLRKKKSSTPSPEKQQYSGESEPKGLHKHVLIWGGHGWRLYKLYRRIRTYLP
jgi:hypothetical protein